MNNWVETALQVLIKCLNPVPVELNEMDWKSGLSDKTERLAQHISAFANHSGGGYLAFGISNSGNSAPLTKNEMDVVIQKQKNF